MINKINVENICIIMETRWGLYFNGTYPDSASFSSEVSSASILDYDQLVKDGNYINSPSDYKVIRLNSKGGLEHILKEIIELDDCIIRQKSDLEMLKERRNKIYEKFPELKDYKRSNQ